MDGNGVYQALRERQLVGAALGEEVVTSYVSSGSSATLVYQHGRPRYRHLRRLPI